MSGSNVSTLNARYGIAGQLAFKEGPGGLPAAEVANAHATACLLLQGAHLTSWAPRGAQPVIWLSPAAKFAAGKSVRGGVPVCWPWFGPHPSRPELPAHGFARTVPWEILRTEATSDGATRLAFRLLQSEATRAQWAPPTELEIHYTIGQSLDIDLLTRNTGTTAVTIGDALHTYFSVSDVRQITIRGLETCPYLDKVDSAQRKTQAAPVTISAETDRIYLDSGADCFIDDPGWQRRIRISKRGSRSTVVWNPWIEKSVKMGDFGENGYLGMVCVESANAADDVVSLGPGQEHHLQVRYALEPLT